MDLQFNQQSYDELALKYGLKDCWVDMRSMSKKKVLRKFAELLARVNAQLDQEQDQADPPISLSDPIQPLVQQEAEVVSDKKAKRKKNRAEDSFSDSNDDKYPKSSPESFGSEPVTTALQPDQSITAVANSDDQKISKEASPSAKQQQPARRTFNTTDFFIVNPPPPGSSDMRYYMQKHNLTECEVELDQLSADFIDKAKRGVIKWKNYFRNPQREMARVTAAEEPDDEEPAYVEEDSDDYELEQEDDDGEEEGSDFEKELIAITRSQEAKVCIDLSPTKSMKRARKSLNSDNIPKPSGRKHQEVGEDGEPKQKKARKSRVVLHKCEACSFSSSSKKELKLHTMKHVGIDLNPVLCAICNVESFSTFDHERHLYEAHEGPKKLPRVVFLTCKSCQQVFEGVKEFDHHVINHIRGMTEGFQCTINKCSFTCAKYASASDHVKTHTLFKCTFCEKSMPRMEMLVRHCNQEHKQFGNPFECCLCPFRSPVYGLLVKHKEEEHAILTDKDVESCKFCVDAEVVFSSKDDMLHHLSLHTDSFHLYKCKECGFTADETSKIHEHNFANHISAVLSDEDSWDIDIAGLVEAVKQQIKKKFKKTTARKKPNIQETDSAVQALAGLLADPDEPDESRSFVSGDLELDAGILAAGGDLGGMAKTRVPSLLNDSGDEENSAPRESVARPKRKSFVDAQVRLQKQKEEEAAERLRKERRRAHLLNQTPVLSTSSLSSSLVSPSSSPCKIPAPQCSEEAVAAAGSATQPMYASSPSTAAPTVPIDSLIRDLDMSENDAIPNEVLNDVFMTDPSAAATVSPFTYDPQSKQIIYNGYALLDEAGNVIEVEADQLPSFLDRMYNEMGADQPAADPYSPFAPSV